MNNIKDHFSIKDLENLSGIKAHTIRIWEKRYRLLSPQRTDTNIRYYTLCNLQKLLNITLLYKNGFKISKIAKLPVDEIPILVNKIVSENSIKNKSINAFKMAMVNFDQVLFTKTYNDLIIEKSFREIFYEIFIPLLNELGFLWQTDTITPAHEHFITGLLKQKIILNTEKIQSEEPANNSNVFVLYLPENEIHEIGLLFLNYELISKGYKTIYLGQTVPIDSLKDILKYYSKITFISYFTVEPNKDRINSYLNSFNKKINIKSDSMLWILGSQINNMNIRSFPQSIKIFKTIKELTDIL